jgi:hypothetical protein
MVEKYQQGFEICGGIMICRHMSDGDDWGGVKVAKLPGCVIDASESLMPAAA